MYSVIHLLKFLKIGVGIDISAKQVDVLPSKNQALSEYCTHFK